MKLDEAKAIDLTKYTPSSGEVLKTAISQAEVVLNKSTATQKEVDDALQALVAAMNGLLELADKAGLQTSLTTAKSKIEAEYTKTTFDVLKAAIAVAQPVFDNKDATSQQVAQAKSSLDTALNALVKAASAILITNLTNKVTEAEAKIAEGIYTAESVAVLQTAVNSAKAALAKSSNRELSETEASASLSQIESALAQLVEKDVE